MFVAPIKLTIENYTKPLNIGGFSIRKITTEEQEKFFGVKDLKIVGIGQRTYTHIDSPFLGCKDHFSILEHSKYMGCEYVVETGDIEYMNNNLKYLLFAFRIYRSGEIFAPIVFNSECPGSVSTQPYFMNHNKSYIIDINEMVHVEQILKNIPKIQSDKRFSLIFDRFNIAINENTEKTGGFTDLISICESLILPNDYQGELSFRFALYGSYLLNILGTSISFGELKELYSDRSKIVHGKSIKDFGVQYDRLYELTIILLREYCDKNIDAKNIEMAVFEELGIN